MCFAFFIATGSFFLGQQDVLPAAVRGSPVLFVLAFAPFAVMAFWLVRVRARKAVPRFPRQRFAGKETGMTEVSPLRLWVMRAMYLLMAVGIGNMIWP